MPFNLVGLAAAAGASYVARWTTMHARRLTDSIARAANKKGFCFIEIVSPCATVFARKNKGGTGLDLLKEFQTRAIIDHDADPTQIPLSMDNEIVCGEFVNEDRPTFWENVQAGIKTRLEKFSNWEEMQSNSRKITHRKDRKYTSSRES
jgi:2-oxoglutarate ferredoxin oxidoreductase subunit beta